MNARQKVKALRVVLASPMNDNAKIRTCRTIVQDQPIIDCPSRPSVAEDEAVVDRRINDQLARRSLLEGTWR